MTGKFIVPSVCPKSSGSMEAGLGFDYKMGELSDDYVIDNNVLVRERWQRTETASGKSLGRECAGTRRVGPRLAIITHRCADCGDLESSAPS